MNGEGHTVWRKKTKKLLVGDDEGSVGLAEEVRTLKRQMKLVLWILGIAVSAIVGAYFK